LELGWSALALIIVSAVFAWFWQDSLGARERANKAAVQACERLSLQFLDGTVAFARIAVVRGDSGLVLRRTYVFDYTANSIERRQGFVVMTAHRIDSVGYAADEPDRSRLQAPPTPEPPPTTVRQARVFHLSEWRETRRPPATNDEGESLDAGGDNETSRDTTRGDTHH
jgi:hypothetical protein